MNKADRNKPIVYGDAFVRMDNELSLYNLLGYSDDKTMRVQPATIDIYRRIKQYAHNNVESHMHGKAWASYERLAIDMAVSRQTISKHVEILKRVGLVSIDKKYRNSKRNYIITINKPMSEAEFRRTYPECVERYYDELDVLFESKDDEWGA